MKRLKAVADYGFICMALTAVWVCIRATAEAMRTNAAIGSVIACGLVVAWVVLAVMDRRQGASDDQQVDI